MILPEFLEGKRDHNRLVGGILATGAVMWVIGAHIIEPLLLPALFAARYHFITILPSRWKSESWETRALFVALFLCIEQVRTMSQTCDWVWFEVDMSNLGEIRARLRKEHCCASM